MKDRLDQMRVSNEKSRQALIDKIEKDKKGKQEEFKDTRRVAAAIRDQERYHDITEKREKSLRRRAEIARSRDQRRIEEFQYIDEIKQEYHKERRVA